MSILSSDSNISAITQTATSSTTTTTNNSDLPTFYEFAWDFKTNDFILEDGDFVILSENDALKVWIYKAVRTQRFRYAAYDFFYGNEYEQLIGKPFNNPVTRQIVQSLTEQCLLVNKYILSVDSVEVELNENLLTGTLTVSTIYGQMEVDLNELL